MRGFSEHTGPDELMHAYRRSALAYSMRLMFTYQRAEWLLPYIDDVEQHFQRSQSSAVLEYGCGVSDMGLLLARHGAWVTYSDLDTRRLEFVRWRYEARGLRARMLAVTNTEEAIDVGIDRYDLVILSEILEHVRDPLALLRSVSRSLKKGGLLLCTAGIGFARDVGGDHLAESIRIGQGAAYREYFVQTFTPVKGGNRAPWLYTKVGS